MESYLGIAFGVAGTIASAYLGYRTVVIQSRLTKAEVTAEKELSAVEQAFKAWQDINAANSKKIEELEEKCTKLDARVDTEAERRHVCEKKLAAVEGRQEVMLGVVSRQTEIQYTQDARQSDRSDAQDALSDKRHDRLDVWQVAQDDRIEEREQRQDDRDARSDVRQNERDARSDARSEARDKVADGNVLHVGDEVMLVKNEDK